MREDYLFVDGQSFRLAEDVDIQEVRRDLEQALGQGSVAVVRVMMNDTNGPVDLLVNGARVRTVTVYRNKSATTLGFS